MTTVHLAIRVFQGVLCDVEVHGEEEPARAKVRDWKQKGSLDSDATYMEAEVIRVGTPVRELGLEVRPYNALRHQKIRTVEQLCEMTERRLLFCRNIGRKGLNQIKEALAARGLSLTEY